MNFLERENNLEELDAALREAAAGAGRVALVSGEAGIGKTTLVEHFTRQQRDAARVLWGACDPLFTPRPFGPLHDMAAQAQGSLDGLFDGDRERGAIFAAVLAELQARPTIAVFEDVHWADEATLDLLKFLGRRIGKTTALLILTYRDDPLGLKHPLRSLLGDLATSPAIRRIPLAPLSIDAVRALAGRRPIDPTRLYRTTGGNPFFVTEILAGADDSLPATVRDAILARAAQLSPAGQAVLQAAAILGQRIEAWLLAEVTGAQPAAVEECMAAGMLVAQAEALAFRHELARQTILESISPPQRLALHRRALDALQRSPAGHGDPTRLAHHAEASGDTEAVLANAPQAARQAAAAGAHREASALYGLTLRFAGQVAPEQRAAWQEARAEQLHTIGALEESSDVRQQAIETWRAAANRPRESLNLSRLAVTLINTGRPDLAARATRAALDLLRGLPPGPELAWAQRTQAHLLMLNRDCAEAVTEGLKAIQLAGQFEDREALVRAYTTVGAALLLTDYPRGREYLEKCLAMAGEIGWEFGIANAYANLGSISCETFHLEEAESDLRAGLAYTGERDMDFLGKYLLAWQALTRLALGRWEQAAQTAQEALQGAGVTAIGRIPALAALGRVRARRGDPQARAPLDEALELAAQSQTLQRLGLARMARAEAAWLAGDPARTLAEARALYELALDKRHAWFTGEAGYWCRQAGGELPPLPRWVAPAYALQMRGDWQGAAAAWERLGCPYERARALADGDRAAQISALETFDRLGARPAAEALRGRLRAAGAAKIPRGPRPGTRENPFGLTGRQLEILGLLVDGLSNAEIAARLHISAKTADHHVSAVLARLEVRSRAAAAELAQKRPDFDKPK